MQDRPGRKRVASDFFTRVGGVLQVGRSLVRSIVNKYEKPGADHSVPWWLVRTPGIDSGTGPVAL